MNVCRSPLFVLLHKMGPFVYRKKSSFLDPLKLGSLQNGRKFSDTTLLVNLSSDRFIQRKGSFSSLAPPSYTSSDMLPRQPVPTLSQTILNFLAFNHVFSKKTHFSVKEAERIIEVYRVCLELARDMKVADFQNRLQERAANLTNWLTPWWIDVAYLEARTPLPIVTSPGVMLPNFHNYALNRDGQIELAINLIYANIAFLKHIICGELLIDRTSAGEPLDMSQYVRLFATTRIPRPERDEIRLSTQLTQWPLHILVTHNGHTFFFPVITTDFEMLPRTQLRRQFSDVFAQSMHENPYPVNVCSADERNAWANVYSRLRETNPQEVRTIEDALFTIGLDRSVSDAKFSRSSQKLRQCLHGGGFRQNTPNRWFDKTLQYAVNERCESTVTYEHTPAEGPPLAALLDFVVDFVSRNAKDENNCEKSCATIRSEVKLLQFDVDDTIEQAIRTAGRNIDVAIDNLEVIYFEFKTFGKNVPKNAKVSPDSFIQVAMQLAFYRMHHCHAPTYETATLRKFAEGRTETLRLPNDASVAFVEAIVDEENCKDLKSLLFTAIQEHKNYSVIAMNGQGMDRHLLGLRMMAKECGQPAPSIFSSKAYKRLMHFRLSTSQVPTRNEMAMCFGPSAIDCYGICYNPQENCIGFTISAYNNCPETSAVKFAAQLEDALCDLRFILNKEDIIKNNSKI